MSSAEPTIGEMKAAIQTLKNGKASDIDITTEAVKAGGDALLHRLHLLLRTILQMEKDPFAWKKEDYCTHLQERRQSGL